MGYGDPDESEEFRDVIVSASCRQARYLTLCFAVQDETVRVQGA